MRAKARIFTGGATMKRTAGKAYAEGKRRRAKKVMAEMGETIDAMASIFVPVIWSIDPQKTTIGNGAVKIVVRYYPHSKMGANDAAEYRKEKKYIFTYDQLNEIKAKVNWDNNPSYTKVNLVSKMSEEAERAREAIDIRLKKRYAKIDSTATESQKRDEIMKFFGTDMIIAQNLVFFALCEAKKRLDFCPIPPR